jgi:hypothetical protein
MLKYHVHLNKLWKYIRFMSIAGHRNISFGKLLYCYTLHLGIVASMGAVKFVKNNERTMKLHDSPILSKRLLSLHLMRQQSFVSFWNPVEQPASCHSSHRVQGNQCVLVKTCSVMVSDYSSHLLWSGNQCALVMPGHVSSATSLRSLLT